MGGTCTSGRAELAVGERRPMNCRGRKAVAVAGVGAVAGGRRPPVTLEPSNVNTRWGTAKWIKMKRPPPALVEERTAKRSSREKSSFRCATCPPACATLKNMLIQTNQRRKAPN